MYVAFGVKNFTSSGEIQVFTVGLLTHIQPEATASSSKCSLILIWVSLAMDNFFSPFPQNRARAKRDFPGTTQELHIMGVTRKAPCLLFCFCVFITLKQSVKTVHVFWSRPVSTHICPKASKIKSQHGYKHHSLHPQHKYTLGQIHSLVVIST